jgi:hypothetical protein
MLHAIGGTALVHLQSLLCGFLQDGSFPCSAVLTVKDIVDLMCQEGVETSDRIFPPVVTLCTFLRQIHCDAPSCRTAHSPHVKLPRVVRAQSILFCKPLTLWAACHLDARIGAARTVPRGDDVAGGVAREVGIDGIDALGTQVFDRRQRPTR